MDNKNIDMTMAVIIKAAKDESDSLKQSNTEFTTADLLDRLVDQLSSIRDSIKLVVESGADLPPYFFDNFKSFLGGVFLLVFGMVKSGSIGVSKFGKVGMN